MPSPITVNLKCELHLIRFMETQYGGQPIVFPRKDTFAGYLNHYLDKAPDNYIEQHYGENNLELQLPYFDDKNVMCNFYLPAYAKAILVDKINELFRVSFRSDINQAFLLGVKRINAIHLFIDKYKLNESCVDMLLKDYQRYRNDVRQQRWRKRQKNLVS